MNIKRIFSNKPLLIASITVSIFIASTCFLIAYSSIGSATNVQESEKIKSEALAKAREFVPEVKALKESSEYCTNMEASFVLQDEKDNNIGLIAIDRSSGKMCLFFDARANSSERVSAEVKINIDKATAIAEDFLKTQGIDLEHYALEKDPLVFMGMEGPPDNPRPVYSYEFNYRIQVDGIFVDDFEGCQGSCLVALSPEDGSIKTLSLPRDLVSLPDLPRDEMKLGKEEALGIAATKIKGVELEPSKIPVVQSNDVELRYMVIKNRLVPYWRVNIRYRDTNLGDLSLLPEKATYLGGCSYFISATDGQILMEGDIW